MIKLLAIAAVVLLTACAAKPTLTERCLELGFATDDELRFCRLELLTLDSNERAAIKAGLAASMFAEHGNGRN